MTIRALVARRIAPCRHAIVAAPAYLEQYGTPRAPEELRDHNIITYRYQDSALDWHFQTPRTPTFIVGKDIQDGRLTPILSGATSLQRFGLS
ncbi:MAG: hypothetical protein JRF54_05270 [Deltaproteobacteria bacterium]|nr:hypothetical protein [Deltaproteobacteria bacterium]MBW2548135.1 hypothetical protein [Deltaproteobacteria bacterium]MBW2719166.1 hypothetical protein [Deltaproteobacteria bacterium]